MDSDRSLEGKGSPIYQTCLFDKKTFSPVAALANSHSFFTLWLRCPLLGGLPQPAWPGFLIPFLLSFLCL